MHPEHDLLDPSHATRLPGSATRTTAGADLDAVHARQADLGLPAGAPNATIAQLVLQRRAEETAVQRMDEEEEEVQMRPLGLPVQRMGGEEVEEEEPLQMRGDDHAGHDHAAHDGGGVDHGAMVAQAMSGGGQALDVQLRSDLEQHVGQDLSSVTVHTGAAAAEASAALGAEAFTVGDHMVFGAGQYDPGSSEGAHRIAHEAQHVVQQRSGPVSATDTGTGVALSDPSDRFEQEAEATASRFRRS